MSSNIVITGAGMMSSLGGCVSACAAARAGITRVGPLESEVGSDLDLYPEKAMGHSCIFLEGLEGYARLSYLLELAFQDLLKTSDLPNFNSENTSFLLNMPDVEQRPLLKEQSDELSMKFENITPKKLLLNSLSSIMNIDFGPQVDTIAANGHAGVLSLLKDAETLLESGEKKWCLISGVDSYIDIETQEWLFVKNKIKTPLSRSGLIPGEGAGVLLLELRETALKRNATILSGVGPYKTGQSVNTFDDDENNPKDIILADLMLGIMDWNEKKDQLVNLIITDMNGADSRAMEWAHVLLRVGKKFPKILDMTLIFPAESFGDVGAATVSISIILAINAHKRGYWNSDEVLICSSSEDGNRGALILQK